MSWFKKPNPGPRKGDGDRRNIPEGLWIKCDKCDAILFKEDLEQEFRVCSKCGFHFKIGHKQYLEILLDEGSYQECDAELRTKDPLNFKEKENYPKYIKSYQKRSGLSEAVVTGKGTVDDRLISVAIHDPSFLAGTMGSVVGEKIARAIRRSIEMECPLIIISTAGGARMQEGILSLMQMAKTALWLTRLSETKIPFISILTNPTMAGVMASYASLGDFTLAEPGAMIGFTGPRVIEQTIRATLPEGFQTAEFFLERGFVDQVVPRTELKATVSRILGYFPDRAAKE